LDESNRSAVAASHAVVLAAASALVCEQRAQEGHGPESRK
jgi:hypothetical protein